MVQFDVCILPKRVVMTHQLAFNILFEFPVGVNGELVHLTNPVAEVT